MAFQQFTGKQYLKIDIANNFGHDKISWDARIHWFDQHEGALESLVKEAKEPALFYAGVKAWRDTQQGKPIGYMISLDATSSGIQLLAALTGDRNAAQLCNVVDTGNREDAYTAIYQEMVHRLGETAKISREMTKQAIMTAFYSSTAMPKKVFGEGALLDVFYDVLKEGAPGAWELNEAFLSFWNPDALSHSWILPDNYHVDIKVMQTVSEPVHFLNEPYDVFYKENLPTEGGRSLGANTIHSIDGMIVRELTRMCDYDPRTIERVCKALAEPLPQTRLGLNRRHNDKMVIFLREHATASGYLSARILDYLDDQNIGLVNHLAIHELLSSLPAKPFKVVSIHDCFRVLPHYGNDLRKQYNLQLEKIAQSDLLSSIVSQILNRPVKIGKMDDRLHKDIAQSNYALS